MATLFATHMHIPTLQLDDFWWEKKYGEAFELLALVKHHRLCSFELRQKVDGLWDKLVPELIYELMAKAESRGRDLDLFETAGGLLAEL